MKFIYLFLIFNLCFFFYYLFKFNKITLNNFFNLILIIFPFILILNYSYFKYHYSIFLIILIINYSFFLIFSILIINIKNKYFKIILSPIIWLILLFLFEYLLGVGFFFEYSLFIYYFDIIQFGSYISLFIFILFISIIVSINFKNLPLNNKILISNKYNKKDLILVFISILIFIFLIFPYSLLIQNNNNNNLNNISILLVQGNFNQDWMYRYNHSKNILENYINLSHNHLDNKGNNFDLIIWPEYAIPLDIYMEDNGYYINKILNFSKKFNSTIILGHVIDNYSNHYDSASVFKEGKLISRYDSIEPVYFNEQTLKGNNLTIIKIKNFSFGIIICYEELNKNLLIKYKKLNVDGIISLTNEQHIDNTLGKYILSDMINLRAKEFGLYFIRVANTGVTKIVNNAGITIKEIPQDQRYTLNYNN